ncbi:MAG: hypothetical protein LUJ09_09325 [Firmicutes bacterium]|nr:hypothetical protein [Bacillota bacterium]
MKQEEKRPIPWEIADPKPPVVQSGHLENRRANADAPGFPEITVDKSAHPGI